MLRWNESKSLNLDTINLWTNYIFGSCETYLYEEGPEMPCSKACVVCIRHISIRSHKQSNLLAVTEAAWAQASRRVSLYSDHESTSPGDRD